MVLQSLSNQIQKKKKKLLQALVVVSGQTWRWVSRSCPSPASFPVLCLQDPYTHPPTPTGIYQALPPQKRHLGARPPLPPQKSQQPHQEALLQKTRDNQDMLKYVDKFREVSGHGRGRPLCEGAEGWVSPRTCASQACPDLVLRRPLAPVSASRPASAILSLVIPLTRRLVQAQALPH